jgi:hypothetical protein
MAVTPELLMVDPFPNKDRRVDGTALSRNEQIVAPQRRGASGTAQRAGRFNSSGDQRGFAPLKEPNDARRMPSIPKGDTPKTISRFK